MTHYTQQSLTPNEALILQQEHEDGEDDLSTIAIQLGMSRRYVANLITHLKAKGLIAINTNFDELWVRLTIRGRHLVTSMWPESQRFTYA